MPQGDKRGNWEFFDATYDGYWESELTRGLGQLTDGKFGPENFRMGYYEYERGKWKFKNIYIKLIYFGFLGGHKCGDAWSWTFI